MDFILKSRDIFQNPQKIPLNEINIMFKDITHDKHATPESAKQKLKKFPALHSIFTDHRNFPLYQPYYECSDDNGKMTESFIAKANEFVEALDFLLQCTYHQFWCYLTKVPNVVKMLKSFLYMFTPLYALDDMDESCLEVYSKIHEGIAMIVSRILTYEHSETEYMSRLTVLRLIEENGLLTFPVALNICTLYSDSCPYLVSNLVDLYFSENRRAIWMKDIDKLLDHVSLVFEMLGGQICGYDDAAVIIPIGVRTKPAHFDPYWYDDIVTFFLDTVSCINGLLGRCDYMTMKALDLGIPYRLTYFYNEVFPIIHKILEPNRPKIKDWDKIQMKIFHRIAKARRECVNSFNFFTTHTINCIIKHQGNTQKQEEFFETYMKLITSAMEHDLFVFDYHNFSAIDVQIHLIIEFYPDLDPMRTDYIIQCLHTMPNIEKVKQKRAKNMAPPPQNDHKTSSPEFNVEPVSPAGPVFTEDEINAKIEVVADTFPDCGDEFILKCLEFYSYDPIEVIHALLEDNLHPSLADLPRNAIRVPPEPAPEQPILAYRGKKPQAKDVKEILDDKTEMEAIKDFILKKSSVTYDMYDDEYDDRDDYEPVPVPYRKGAHEDDDPFAYMERRFEDMHCVSDPSESSDDEAIDEGAKGAHSKPRDGFRAFCEDPAKLREQRELARKNFGSRRGSGPRRDVVGKPKGQGQDAQTQKSRDKKTVNKSSRANHSRKSGAQWKRSRGMYS